MRGTYRLYQQLYNIRIQTALIIVVVPLILVISYANSAYIDFLTLNQTGKNGAQSSANKFTAIDRFHIALRKKIELDFNERFKTLPSINSRTTLETYYVYIDRKNIAKLNSNLPESGKDYVKGFMLNASGKIEKIKLRYRGSTPLHWAYKQKSLRIKLAKGRLNQMERVFNLVNPPHKFFPIDYVSYDISRVAGLLTPDSKPVRVFINNEYRGVYSYLSQIDESTLRKNKRMPGSIYYGENPRMLDNQGVSMLWQDPLSWVKKASRHQDDSNSREDINTFISAIMLKPVEFYGFFNQYTNKHRFYTFFGIDTLLGSGHHDYAHNHKLYFSPYVGKFEPIQWDVRFWLPIHQKDVATYPLLLNVALNPILEMERDQVGYQLLKQFPSHDIIGRLRESASGLRSELKNDIYRDHGVYYKSQYYPELFSLQEFDDAINEHAQLIHERALWLTQFYHDGHVSFELEQLNDSTIQLAFQATGNSPVAIDLEKFFPGKMDGFAMYKDINNNKLAEPDERISSGEHILYPGRKIVHGNEMASSTVLKGTIKLRPSPLTYAFIIKNGGHPVPKVLAGKNTITGSNVVIPRKSFKQQIQSTASVHPWTLPELQTYSLERLQGRITVNDDLIFPRGSHVEILPGTRFVISPNKSIFFYGKVEAIGTKDNPIVFVAQSKTKPWGSIVLQGAGTRNSRFFHVRISNGSTTKKNLIDYPGQFNIHDSMGFQLSYCHIGSNHIGDDNVHIANSQGEIKNCVFYQSNQDALDIDISTVNISNSLFLSSGNDALDLMTSVVSVNNSLFDQAKDKCLSVGEYSKSVFDKNILSNCHIGIEVKDKSEVKLTTTLIVDAKTLAINLFNKNHRYDEGGKLTVDNLFLIGNSIIKLDDKSKIIVKDKYTHYPDKGTFGFIEDRLNLSNNWVLLQSKLKQLSHEYP